MFVVFSHILSSFSWDTIPPSKIISLEIWASSLIRKNSLISLFTHICVLVKFRNLISFWRQPLNCFFKRKRVDRKCEQVLPERNIWWLHICVLVKIRNHISFWRQPLNCFFKRKRVDRKCEQVHLLLSKRNIWWLSNKQFKTILPHLSYSRSFQLSKSF